MDKPSTRILTEAYKEDNLERCGRHVDLFTGEEYNPKDVKIKLEDIEKHEKINIHIPTLIKAILKELDRIEEKINEK